MKNLKRDKRVCASCAMCLGEKNMPKELTGQCSIWITSGMDCQESVPPTCLKLKEQEDYQYVSKHNDLPSEEANRLLHKFSHAAEKQECALHNKFGGWGHSVYCNFQSDIGNGEGRCNCGLSDMLTCLKNYRKAQDEEDEHGL